MSMDANAVGRIFQQHPVNAGRIVHEGLLAGMMGALGVGFIQLGVDFAADALLRTPSALYLTFFDQSPGAHALSTGALTLRFTLAHVALWLGVGLLASLIVSVSDAYPKLWYTACAATSFIFLSLLYASIFIEVPGLPRFYLSLGVITGPAVMFAWLARRHPGVLKHFDRAALTEVGAHDLADALCEERRAQRLYQRALGFAPNTPVLAAAIAVKQRHIDRLLDVFDRMDAIPPGARLVEPELDPASLAEVYREAISCERKTVEMYDRFLAAVNENRIRDVFVHLRESSADELLPSLERALEALRPA